MERRRTLTISFLNPAELDNEILAPSLRRHQNFLRTLSSVDHRTESPLVANVRTTMRLLQTGDTVMPVTINEEDYHNAWVCSPFNAIITYPLDELKHVKSRALRLSIRQLVKLAAPLLQAVRINRVVTVNNWLLSTNLYLPADETACDVEADVHELTQFLVERYPTHAILFRSLNTRTNARLMRSLISAGYQLAPSRQVYFFDGCQPEFLRHQNTKRDLKLLQTTSLSRMRHQDFRAAHDSHVRALYDLLYLEKYSQHNPQFTPELIRCWRESGSCELFGFNVNGKLSAVVGTFSMGSVVTAPLVGYDTSLPQQMGLYRLLMAHVLRQTESRKQLLNLSAGAASFKRLRGGEPAMEYSAVYCQHLPVTQRLAWKSLAVLLEQVGARMLRKYKL